MEAKHTPGPWRVGNEYGASQLSPRVEILRDVTYVEGVRPTTYLIGEVGYPTTTGNTVGASERAANARLIAAAPELLDALQKARIQLPLAAASWNEEPQYAPNVAAVLQLIAEVDAVLAKATGGAA